MMRIIKARPSIIKVSKYCISKGPQDQGHDQSNYTRKENQFFLLISKFVCNNIHDKINRNN